MEEEVDEPIAGIGPKYELECRLGSPWGNSFSLVFSPPFHALNLKEWGLNLRGGMKLEPVASTMSRLTASNALS